MKKLDDLNIPKASDEAKERTVRMCLEEYDKQYNHQHYILVFWRNVAIGSVLLVLGFGYYTMHLTHHNSTHIVEPSSREAKKIILAETKRLFKKNLKALIKQNGEYDVILANGNEAYSQQGPIIITLEKGGVKTQIISFNGQNIDLQLGDKTISLELLLQGDRSIFIVGDDFIWQKNRFIGNPEYSVYAEEL